MKLTWWPTTTVLRLGDQPTYPVVILALRDHHCACTPTYKTGHSLRHRPMQSSGRLNCRGMQLHEARYEVLVS